MQGHSSDNLSLSHGTTSIGEPVHDLTEGLKDERQRRIFPVPLSLRPASFLCFAIVMLILIVHVKSVVVHFNERLCSS